MIRIVNKDCVDFLRDLQDSSIDAVVTDPPYEIGICGKSWDSTGIAFDVNFWKQVVRVLKPGGYLLSFSAARTYHRIAAAVEDAGFEVRDQMMWLYGSGFPKGNNIANAIDKALGVEQTVVGQKEMAIISGSFFGGDRQVRLRNITVPTSEEAKRWTGWNTTLKPAHEPLVLARKPIEGTVAENVLRFEVGGINVDGCRIPGEGADHPKGRWPSNVIMDEAALKILEEQAPGAAKFFYCPKPSKAEKGENNTHLTVKPIRLMEYLIELVCPEGGTVLDPFMGSGTTAIAALRCGRNFAGSEMEKEHFKIADERILMEIRKKEREGKL